MKSCRVGPAFLSRRVVDQLVPVAASRKVSAVARGPRGFLQAWQRGLDPWWCRRRAAFVARHMAQVTQRDEPLWDAKGRPTRRHLALAMWAYSPDPTRLARWARHR